jgi:ankyrin repeat protein
MTREPEPIPLSPLMQALYRGERDRATEILASLDHQQLTIHEAAAAGVTSRVAQVISADPTSVNSWSPDGFQPLGLAAFFGHPEAVDLLLAHGGEVNTKARHPFGVAALHAALAGPTPDIARAVIAAGADVNATQSDGSTPLHTTAHNDAVELTQLLLDHGADPRKANGNGRTPLDIAREHGRTAVADLLARLYASAGGGG